MSALLLLTVAIWLAALAGSVVLWVRTRDARVAVLAAAFAALGLAHGIAMSSAWGTPLGLDAASAGAAASFAASALGVLVLVGLARTLAERDRTEALHWDSMEAVRELSELGARRELDLGEKFAALLHIGRARFAMDVGVVSRVKGERYEILAIQADEGFPIRRGAVFPLDQTYCQSALSSERPVAIENTANAKWAGNPTRTAFRFGSYLGAAIRVDDKVFGTIGFGSLEPRAVRFPAANKDLIALMAHWLGSEIERRRRRPLAPALHARAEERAIPRRPARAEEARPRGNDVNAILHRMEAKLRWLAGDRVKLTLALSPNLDSARPLAAPLESIILSLVRNALDAMPEGGELTLDTANLDVAAGNAAVVPAVAPNRYVTLSVHDTGAGIDPNALARVFGRSAQGEPSAGSEEDLALPTVYRILQRSGGDLSAHVDPGRGSTFTVFLPRLEAAPRSTRKEVAVRAPGARSN